MLITIYDSTGTPKAELSPNDSSTQVKEIQGDSVLTLSFTHYDHISLDVDDYVDFEGERFWLTEKYRPRQNARKEWVYDIKLYGVESMLKRLLVVKTVDDEDDPVFTLTAPPHEHVATIVKCMNNGLGNITDWKVGQVDGTENIVIDYFGKYCDEALKEIAEKVGAEAWVEGQTVNICKCEHGEPIPMGYDKGLLSIDPGTADNVKFYTRLYPVGSSRNIDREKYGYSRLQLPGGEKYVEINADKYGRVDHYEADAFADIYPRRTGIVSNVRSEIKTGEDGNPFTIYYFSDNSLPFDPNAYEIGGLVKRVSFQEGSELAGLGEEDNGTYFFEVNFNSSTREFEIITIWPYDNDMQLPGDKLIPKIGDKYILWNLRMPDEYYELAEAEFMSAVDKYNADHNLDISVYKAPTDHVWIEDNGIVLTIGQRIRLESDDYFPETGYRDSRITKITRKVNLPSSMDIEISDALSRTSLEKMADSISEVRTYAEGIAGSVALPDIIRTGDNTRPTDNNLLSAKRSYADMLRKDRSDSTPYQLGVGSIKTNNFVSGLCGGVGAAIDERGNSEVESIRVRTYMEIMELIVNRLSAIEGDQLLTEADTIEEVIPHPDGVTFTLKIHPKWEGYFTAQIENNVCKGIFNNITDNLTPGVGQTVMNNATYYTSWFRVLTVNPAANTMDVILYPDDETPAGRNFPPVEMMKFARWGNSGSADEARYAMRQSVLFLSSTDGRIMKYDRVTKPIIDAGNIAFCVGTLPEAVADRDPRTRSDPEGGYFKNLVVENLIQMDHLGKPRPTLRFRGSFSEDADYYGGDTLRETTGDYEQSVVEYYGCQWLCNRTGTHSAPSWKSTDWTFYLGDSSFRVELRGGPAAVNPRKFRFALSVIGEKGGQDVTADILPQDVVWTRYTEDSGGNERVESDTIWATRRGGSGTSIEITEADLDAGLGVPDVCIFTATVTLRDGTEHSVEYGM